MRAWQILLSTVGLVCAIAAVGAEAQRLTAYERSQGWRLLFDGRSHDDWRGYRLNKLPDNWQIKDGALAAEDGPGLVTESEWGDFELTFEWRVGEGGAVEVFFHVSEDGISPGDTGPVMQLAGHGGSVAANGGLNKPRREIAIQPGVWCQAKVVVFGYQVEYWINGEEISTYLIDGAEWRAAVTASVHRGNRDYGLLHTGRIVFAGHGAAFRLIKARSI